VARPSKPALLKTGRDENKAQLKIREEQEKRLMGNSDKLKNVPEYLDPLAKAYYKFLISEMEIG
jgi:phage terminase small subunit